MVNLGARAVTARTLEIFATYGVEAVLESSIRTARELQEALDIFPPPQLDEEEKEEKQQEEAIGERVSSVNDERNCIERTHTQ
jgi:hypothetical protein